MQTAFEPLHLFCSLYRAFGPQGWWPASTLEEIVWGAILTQAVNWGNAAKALDNLRRHGLLAPDRLLAAEAGVLADIVRPAGYHRVKARKLQAFAAFWQEQPGGLETLLRQPTPEAREALLGVWGVGPETADSILLYGGNHPVLVVDAYSHRIALRHGCAASRSRYSELQRFFSRGLPADPQLLNEFHALLVEVGKRHCRPRSPGCADCPVSADSFWNLDYCPGNNGRGA